MQNNKPFPEKAVVFTFDDGYRDNYLAYQILKKYNATGTFYITAGCIESQEIFWLFETIYLVKATSSTRLTFQATGEEFTYLLNSEAERELASRKIVQFIKSNNRDVRESIRAQLREQTADVPDFEAKASKVMLTWQQIREMNDNGMTIGGHTMTHLNLPIALADDAMNEIENCKALLQEKTGSSVHHFSYPNGGPYAYYNPDIKNMVKKA
ncbi:MAG: polysaccharide deacetylase family protein, partial [Bacteroidetes bacterium]|nr:polysaccharide deacetylase family protein [Bacteroidota bacterium]